MRHYKSLSYILPLVISVMAVAISLNRARAQPTALPPASTQTALGTAFTYQGQLKDNGAPAKGSYDFQFVLYDAAVDGSQVAATPIITQTGVLVSDGQFTVQLDFGDVFSNTKLFLEVGVRPGGTAGSYTILSPRQEITPVPYAQYAINASTAVNAQSVPWTGVTGKPDALSRRRIYVPAEGFGYSPSANISAATWGLEWKNASQSAGFVLPQPSDWDQTTPFTVTLYFALPSAPSSGTISWRLQAGGCIFNSTPDNAATGWDSLNYRTTEDAPLLSYSEAGGYFNLMKVQSWTSKWSSTYRTWYFGDSVTVANSFVRNPIWHFAFQRGAAVGNGESYTGDLLVVAADITYTAIR